MRLIIFTVILRRPNASVVDSLVGVPENVEVVDLIEVEHDVAGDPQQLPEILWFFDLVVEGRQHFAERRERSHDVGQPSDGLKWRADWEVLPVAVVEDHEATVRF